VVALVCALAVFAASAAGVSAAKAIVITKKTDQSTPELFSNFASTATLGVDGQSAQVTGTVDCDGPTATPVPVQIWVLVWQSGQSATGLAHAACTGSPEPWTVDVAASGTGFVPGEAHAHAWVGVAPEAGGGPAAFDWGRAITLAH
jgi:hypothetical protein